MSRLSESKPLGARINNRAKLLISKPAPTIEDHGAAPTWQTTRTRRTRVLGRSRRDRRPSAVAAPGTGGLQGRNQPDEDRRSDRETPQRGRRNKSNESDPTACRALPSGPTTLSSSTRPASRQRRRRSARAALLRSAAAAPCGNGSPRARLRTASSRRRAAPRASIRFATFAHARRSTSPTAPGRAPTPAGIAEQVIAQQPDHDGEVALIVLVGIGRGQGAGSGRPSRARPRPRGPRRGARPRTGSARRAGTPARRWIEAPGRKLGRSRLRNSFGMDETGPAARRRRAMERH